MMEKPTIRILADSSCDLVDVFPVAPLKIITADKEYVDDSALDVAGMVEALKHYKGKSSTSCPNAEDWLSLFGEAEAVICVTITGTLSGSYNAACMAKELYETAHPERRVFVVNSLSVGPEMVLLLERLQSLAAQGASFEACCEAIEAYRQRTGLLFVLESMNNLANNGRVNRLLAKAAGVLGVRAVGCASAQGDLQLLAKCRGEQKTVQTLIQLLGDQGYAGGKLHIAHCFNEKAADALKEAVEREFTAACVTVYPCRGLCSFYAEQGGLLVGFEKSR